MQRSSIHSQDSLSKSSEGIRLTLDDVSAYNPNQPQDSSFAHLQDGPIQGKNLYQKVYRISKIFENSQQIAIQQRNLNPNSSFQNTKIRGKLKKCEIQNLKTIHDQIKNNQDRLRLRNIAKVFYSERSGDSVLVHTEFMQFHVDQLEPHLWTAENVVQIILQYMNGLQQFESMDICGLDCHKGNFMVSIIDGKLIGKHIDFQLFLYIHPKNLEEERNNREILKSRTVRQCYKHNKYNGEEIAKLAKMFSQKYKKWIQNKEGLKKIHNLQLLSFVKDIIGLIQDKKLKKVVQVLKQYEIINTRIYLKQSLQKCLEDDHQNEQQNEEQFDFQNEKQLEKLFQQSQFISEQFEVQNSRDKIKVKNGFFIKPIYFSFQQEKLPLQQDYRTGITLIVDTIQNALKQKTVVTRPKLYRKICQLLKWQLQEKKFPEAQILNQSLVGERYMQSQNDSVPMSECNHSMFSQLLVQNLRKPSSSQPSERFEPNVEPKQNVQRTLIRQANPTRRIMEAQDEFNDFINEETQTQFKKGLDFQLFMNFLERSPPDMIDMTKKQEHREKFRKLYNYLLSYGFHEQALPQYITKVIKFNQYPYLITRLYKKIEAKSHDLFYQHKTEIIQFINSKYLAGLIEGNTLGLIVQSYFNDNTGKHYNLLRQLRDRNQYLLNPHQQNVFFTQLNNLIPKEEDFCQVFRKFLKQHILGICENAKMYLQDQRRLLASTISQRSPLKRRESERQQSQRTRQYQRGKRDRMSDSAITVKPIVPVYQNIDNSKNFSSILNFQQNFPRQQDCQENNYEKKGNYERIQIIQIGHQNEGSQQEDNYSNQSDQYE